MGADNWGVCPLCKLNEEKEHEQNLLEAGKLYGKYSPEDYLKAVELANVRRSIGTTLREDFWLRTDEDGFFSCEYSCRCDCGYGFKFEHKKQTDVTAF